VKPLGHRLSACFGTLALGCTSFGELAADAIVSETAPALMELLVLVGFGAAYQCEHGSWPDSAADVKVWVEEKAADSEAAEDEGSGVDWTEFEDAEFQTTPSGEFVIRLFNLGNIHFDCPEEPAAFKVTVGGCDSENRPRGVKVEGQNLSASIDLVE
jgi:hypothetical protein